MSVLQIARLLDYLEGQPELALGRCTRTKEGRSLSRTLWQECAALLNNVSPDCVQKTPEQWRLFYNEYKHKMLKKLKTARNEVATTGGGASQIKTTSLTPLQERLHNILERDGGEPLPGVFYNPISKQINRIGDEESDFDLQTITPQVEYYSNARLEAALNSGNARSADECRIATSELVTINTPNIGDGDDSIESEDGAVSGLTISDTDDSDDRLTSIGSKNMERNCKPCTAASHKSEKSRKKERLVQQYLRYKLKNAKFEQKCLINRNKMEINKYKLEMKILKMKLHKLSNGS